MVGNPKKLKLGTEPSTYVHVGKLLPPPSYRTQSTARAEVYGVITFFMKYSMRDGLFA